MWEREKSGKPARGLSGRVGQGENLQEDRQPLTPPPTSSNWGQGDWAPSWSPISPGLGSFSQVSGTNEQEEESALRGPRGSLGLCPFWGADPWAERAVRRGESRPPPPPLPGGAAAAQGRSPPRTESPWPAAGEPPGARAPWLGLLSALAREGTGGQPRGQSLQEAACAGGKAPRWRAQQGRRPCLYLQSLPQGLSVPKAEA